MLAPLTLALALAVSVPPPPAPSAAGPEAIGLGIAQDGGVPHAGCHQPVCVAARSDPSRRRMVASLGLTDPAAGKRFLIDATPDFPAQMEALGGLPDAILLTHAHIGHSLGLAQLGREVLGARGVPVYATPSMARFLRGNRPWSHLVTFGNVDVREISHPLVPETMARVQAMSPPARGRVVFVHLNHTNRLLRDADALAALERRGFSVAREGERVPFSARTDSPE